MRPAHSARSCSAWIAHVCRPATLPLPTATELFSKRVNYLTARRSRTCDQLGVGRRCPNTRACRLGLGPGQPGPSLRPGCLVQPGRLFLPAGATGALPQASVSADLL